MRVAYSIESAKLVNLPGPFIWTRKTTSVLNAHRTPQSFLSFEFGIFIVFPRHYLKARRARCLIGAIDAQLMNCQFLVDSQLMNWMCKSGLGKTQHYNTIVLR